jgi:hypothetical protein
MEKNITFVLRRENTLNTNRERLIRVNRIFLEEYIGKGIGIE